MFSGQKKYWVVLCCSLLIFILSGCGNTLKSEFIKAIQKNSNQTSASFEMSIPELELDANLLSSPKKQSDGSLELIKLIAPQLSTFRISGDYTMDFENKNTLELNTNVDLFGQKIPINLIANSEKQYLSLDFFAASYAFVENFSGINPTINQNTTNVDLKSLAGRYINLEDLNLTATGNKTAFSKETWKIARDHSYTLQTEFAKYIDSLNKNQFSKKDQTISLDLTKDNLEEMIGIYLKMSQEPKYNSIFPRIKSFKQLQQMLQKEIKNLKVTYLIDTKTNISKITLLLESKDSLKTGIKKMKIVLTTEQLKFKGTPNLPTENQIISKDEFNQITQPMQTIQP